MTKLFDLIWQGKLSRLRAVLLACLQEVRIFAIVYRYGIRAEDGCVDVWYEKHGSIANKI